MRELQLHSASMMIVAAIMAVVTGTVCSETRADCTTFAVELINAPCSPGGAIPLGLSAGGHVAGHYGCIAFFAHPFVWDGQAFAAIPLPQGTSTGEANAVNSAGQTVGWMGAFAFLYEDRGVTNLGTLPGQNMSEARSISDSKPARIVGYSQNPSIKGPDAVYWQDGVITALDVPLGPNSVANDVNNKLQVCGWMGGAPHTNAHPFIWDAGRTIDLGLLPGAIGAEARALNENGSACGIYRKDGKWLPFGWIDGNLIELPLLSGATQGFALDINYDNVIVGFCGSPNKACVWRDGVVTELLTLIPPGSGLKFSRGVGINDSEQIAVDGGLGTNSMAVLLTPVPGVLGDANCDNVVDVDDLLTVINGWGKCEFFGPCSGDFDDDDAIGVGDLLIVIDNWTF